ncbi:MAG TPA: molybdopterin molybdotransferase MoeA [Sulfurimonas sp.]|nr:molybdopterin molybdotransferase MoeA [Sulfurimonas sp.]
MAILIEDALKQIDEWVEPLHSEIVSLEASLGRILSNDIIAVYNLPAFNNSAMDGYAIKHNDEGKEVIVGETIFAGDNSDATVSKGCTLKIMTGAPIPMGAEAVVPIEDIEHVSDNVISLPSSIRKEQHIRYAGEDIKAGDLLLKSGHKLHAHHITMLASQGISHVYVTKRPRVAVFASGKELKMHFETVEDHQIHNTNTPTFLARARELGCEVIFIGTAEDTIEDIKAHISSALEGSDLIITSGGVSVGDADFTKEAFDSFDYEKYFSKINIKPGKPTTFGRIGRTYVLNLPGNPLAAAVNFEIFAQSIILKLHNARLPYIGTFKAKMKKDFVQRAGKYTVIPGYYDGEFFTPVDKRSPGMVTPLAQSNAFMITDDKISEIKAEETILLIPTRWQMCTKEKSEIITTLSSKVS